MLNAQINRSRRIGVEYEMTVPLVGTGTGMDVQRTLASVMSANGIRAIARGYCHDPLPQGADIAVEYDTSVQGETRFRGISWFAVEVKTRILNGIDDWEQIVPKTLDLCRYMGARVNASTGHHVHLSLPEASEKPKVIRSLTSLIARIEPVLYGMLAPSRRNSTYCIPLGRNLPDFQRCKTLDQYGEVLCGWPRYRGLNLTHVAELPPRVEYRYHQGTLDVEKARHWLRLLLQVTEHAVTRNCQSLPEPLANDRKGFERMATAIGLRVNSKIYQQVSTELSETARFLLRRWKHFNGHPMRQSRPTLAAQAVEREVG